MRVRKGLLLGILLLFVVMTSTADAGRRRACRLWNYGAGYHNCLDTCTGQICGPVCSQPCNYQEVECTVMVPHTFYETRKVTTTEYQRQERPRKITVYDRVPREEVRHVKYTVCDPVQRQRKVDHWTCRPVWEEREIPYSYCEPVYEKHVGVRHLSRPVWENVEQEYTIMVPRTVWHTGVRQVCRTVRTTEVRKVCVDRGCWEEVAVQPPVCEPCVEQCQPACFAFNSCDLPCLSRRGLRRARRAARFSCGPVCPPPVNCAPCLPRTCRVWRPNIVQIDVPHVVCRPVYTQEEYKYCTTVCEPKVCKRIVKVCRQVPYEEEYTYTTCRYVERQAVRKVRVCRYVRECNTRVVNYTEWVPRTEVKDIRYTVYDCVPREKVIVETVCVPVCVEREVKVPVCRMVPQKVVRRVPVPCSSCGTAGCPTCAH